MSLKSLSDDFGYKSKVLKVYKFFENELLLQIADNIWGDSFFASKSAQIYKKILLKMSRSSDKVYMFICIRMDTEYIVNTRYKIESRFCSCCL